MLFLTAAALLLFAAMFLCAQMIAVKALVPNIVSLSYRDVGATTWLDITISHQPPPDIGAGHYVTVIQLEINGTTVNLNQTPQSTVTFTVEYSLGSSTNTYSVSARALCNVHGYSAWSNQVVVPESTTVLVVILLTTFAAVLALKCRRINHNLVALQKE